jgi:Tfp pilus assembly protein PilF
MSLLLEALKKAERAKEEAAQRRAKTEPETIAAAAAPEAAVQPDPLPEIRPPLEIVRDEPTRPPEPAPAPAPAAPAPSPRPQPKAEALAGDRAAARKVFEAKFREPNPRLPFFITMGALGVFAVGTVLYFWMQLRPPAPLVNLNPKPPAGEQVAAAPKAPAPSAPAPAAAKSAIPGLPAAAPVIKPEPTPRIETPILKPAARPTAPPARNEPAPTEVTTTRATPQVNAKVSTGYAAYLAGDLATARTEYEQALREEPANRDALLGMAALDVRAGRFEAAEGAYQRLLRADPRDAHAHAALIALRGGRFDPAAAESRVKSMLAENPGTHVLNFTLGNQFAQQGRWAEAQQEFFKAFAAEPENADFAYNLAVSLDHLRQPRLALEYYQRALTLAKARGASFDSAAAEARAAQLR